ncbi:MAG TPA: hypothetical protein VNT50_01180 [Microbacterium sp.]|uniref:hypothetical protein n=1 Tax=Microbacterium sp. TaxID=51671 RepID=UPI002B6C6401|nr:hypothetical protein [Microbacterium sp.]HWI30080.1 hypothetical protein [Microbacterium sp.]
MTSNGLRTTARATRLQRAMAYDGVIPAMLRAIFQYFVVSVCFVTSLIPLIAFQVLVTWQPTHLAIWLAALSVSPLPIGLYALLASGRELLAGGSDAHGGRVFWRAFSTAARRLWWMSLVTSALAGLLGYDVAVTGAGDGALLLVMGVAAAWTALLIGVCVAALALPAARPATLLAEASIGAVRRPHVALSWLLLTGIALALTAMPLIGPSLALFVPAGAAVCILICSDALGFTPTKAVDQ